MTRDAGRSCMRLADLDGTGEHKLIVADMDKKLKIYSGTVLQSTHTLLDVPVALCTFYPGTVWAVRVAACSRRRIMLMLHRHDGASPTRRGRRKRPLRLHLPQPPAVLQVYAAICRD